MIRYLQMPGAPFKAPVLESSDPVQGITQNFLNAVAEDLREWVNAQYASYGIARHEA